MKIKVDSTEFIRAITAIKPATYNSNMPVLSNIKFMLKDEILTIAAFDISNYIEIEVELEVTCDDNFEVLVPFTVLSEAVSTMKGIITLKDKDNSLLLTSKSSKFRLPYIEPSVYPRIPEEYSRHSQSDKSILVKDLPILKSVAKTASSEISKQTLCGVLINSAGFSATDGFRLNTMMSTLDPKDSVIIPKEFIGKLSDSIVDREFFFEIRGNVVLVKSADFLYATRVIEGSYPDVSKLIPNSFVATLRDIDRNLLDAALKKCKITATNNLVELNITSDSLELYSQGEYGECKSLIDCSNDCEEPLTVLVSIPYLKDALDLALSDKVTLNISGSLSPLTITSSDEYYTQSSLIMPLMSRG